MPVSVFVVLPISVLLASQTTSTIAMSGMNALRKRRFTKTPRSGYRKAFRRGAGFPSCPPLALHALRQQLHVKPPHVGEIAVALGEVEPVADHEAIGDLEADVAHLDLDPAALGLGQERTDTEARGLPRLEVAHEVGERQPRVDDVLDDEHVTTLDVDVE